MDEIIQVSYLHTSFSIGPKEKKKKKEEKAIKKKKERVIKTAES
jgi:hypothetical protein